MNSKKIIELIKYIVQKSKDLSEFYTNERNLRVNYVCIFSQSNEEYSSLVTNAKNLGEIIHETAMGSIFLTKPIKTISGNSRILKIRRPDKNRLEKGDADFTLLEYDKFKSFYLGKSNFRLIVRESMEMIELIDDKYDVLVYYSNPTLAETLNIKLD